MDEKQAPKKRGRKQKYDQLTPYQDGAPLLTTRIDPEKLAWVKSQPEGTRPYLERIIGEDREKVLSAESATAAAKRSDTGPEAADT